MLVEKREIVGVKSLGSGRALGPVELGRCVFDGSALAQFDDPGMGLVVRDVTARRCRVVRSVAQGVRFEDVRVDGLAVTSQLNLNGCVFKHVTLTESIGPLMAAGPNSSLPQGIRDRLTAGIAAYYADVDRALGICRASFCDADLSYVPGHLVLRDEETRFLLHRDRVKQFGGLDGLPAFAQIAARRFEATPFDTSGAVAPRRSQRFATRLAELEVLRAEGLAD